MGSIRRLLIVVLLAPWLAVSAVIAREHVHESHSPDHESVAHTHLALHTDHHDGIADHDHAIADHDHDGAEMSDIDEDVVWMDEVGIAESTRWFTPLLAVLSTHVEVVPELPVPVAVVADEATLAHGPPRVSPSLRAPPSSSR